MFGKTSLGKSLGIIKKVFKKVKIKGKFETGDNFACGVAYDVAAYGENVGILSAYIYQNGDIFLGAVFGHLEKTPQNLLLLQEYNKESLGWRAYIDDDGDLNLDLDCFCVNPRDYEKFLYENLNSFADDDTMAFYHELCHNCT